MTRILPSTRSILLIALAVFLAWGSTCGHAQPVVKVEIYSGVYLDVPEDWMIAADKTVIGTGASLAGKAPPPVAQKFERLLFAPPTPGTANFSIMVSLLSPERGEETRQAFSPSQFSQATTEISRHLEENIRQNGRALKSPVRVERATISGVPAVTAHADSRKEGDSDGVFDTVYLCAGNALISVTAYKHGYAPDAWAQLDRMRGSLSLATSVPRTGKPYESSAPPSDPLAAQKKADGTVWNLFSGLAKGQPGEPAAAAESWQNSWEAFARELQAMYGRGAKRDEFIRRFNGQRVVWEGEMQKIEQLSREGFRVSFHMPDQRIRFPDGQSYALDQLLITLPNGTAIPAGKKVRFRATLSNGPEPAVSYVSLPSENLRVITVSTSGVSELVK